MSQMQIAARSQSFKLLEMMRNPPSSIVKIFEEFHSKIEKVMEKTDFNFKLQQQGFYDIDEGVFQWLYQTCGNFGNYGKELYEYAFELERYLLMDEKHYELQRKTDEMTMIRYVICLPETMVDSFLKMTDADALEWLVKKLNDEKWNEYDAENSMDMNLRIVKVFANLHYAILHEIEKNDIFLIKSQQTGKYHLNDQIFIDFKEACRIFGKKNEEMKGKFLECERILLKEKFGYEFVEENGNMTNKVYTIYIGEPDAAKAIAIPKEVMAQLVRMYAAGKLKDDEIDFDNLVGVNADANADITTTAVDAPAVDTPTEG